MSSDPVVDGKCPTCNAITATPYRLLGSPTSCSSCGVSGVAELVVGSSIPYTGFALTYRDLESLVTDAHFRERVGPLVESSCACRITGTGSATTIVDAVGDPLELMTIHHTIQDDPDTAYRLYQIAMDYWR